VDWWPWERIRVAREAPDRLPVEVPDAVREAVAVLAGAGDAEWRAAERLAAHVPSGHAPRPIWLSSRAATPQADGPWLRAAVVGGWAVLRDPVEGPPAPTFLWARPTLAIGAEPELTALLEAVGGLAPARRAERWRARHLARLETLIVEPGEGAGGLETTLERLGLALRVVRLPAGEW